MNKLQKIGGISAFYMATAYLVGIVFFLLILDYPSIVDPAQKMSLLVEKQLIIYITNLFLYVIFGFFLIALTLALYERLNTKAPAMIRVATAIGIIWAGALIASGMVANAGIAPVVKLYSEDPAQATMTWLAIESVANGLGGASGEILGGVFTLMISWAALKSGKLQKGLNYLGLVVAVVGITSTVPGLNDLAGLFGISQIVWFIWLGIVLLRQEPLLTT
jgi:hypothetical protein